MTAVDRRSFVLLMVAAAVLFGGSCRRRVGVPAIVITRPSETSLFTNDPTIQVAGQLQNVDLAAVTDVTVNGVSVLPLGPGTTFSATVGLDPVAIFNPIVAEVHFAASSWILRDRRTVIVGDGNPAPGGTGFVLEGDLSPQAVALRLLDSGLDQAEPVIAGTLDLDLAAMVPVGTSLGDVAGFATFVDNPPPRFGSLSIDVDSQTQSVDTHIDLTDVAVDLFLDGWWIFDCTARITTPLLEINGSYGLQPDSGDPTLLDVDQIGGVSFGSTQFALQITSGVACVLGELFGLIGNVNGEIQNGLSGFLNVVDANGNTPLSAAIEGALAGIEISGPIGSALGVSLEAPLSDVLEDVEGVTLESESRITALLPDPDAPDLPASYQVNGSFPGFTSTTPGGLPYDLGVAISTSTFNQLLKAETESGLLRFTGANAITEFDLDGPGGNPPIPLTSLMMAAFVPEFAVFPADKLFKIEIKPLLAPILTGMVGPQGELVEIRVAHLLFEIRDVAQDVLFLQAAVDCRLGADVVFVNGEIAFNLGTLLPTNIDAVVLFNNVNTNEIVLVQVLQFLLPSLLPALTNSLGSFPLPAFLGLSLQGVEIASQDSFVSIFADLIAAP